MKVYKTIHFTTAITSLAFILLLKYPRAETVDADITTLFIFSKSNLCLYDVKATDYRRKHQKGSIGGRK